MLFLPLHCVSDFELTFSHSPGLFLLSSSPVTHLASRFFNYPHKGQDFYSHFMPYVGVDLNVLRFVLRCLGDFWPLCYPLRGHFVLSRQSRNAEQELPGAANTWSPSILKAAIRKQEEPKQCFPPPNILITSCLFP